MLWDAFTGHTASFWRPLLALCGVVVVFAGFWAHMPLEGAAVRSPLMMSLSTLLHVPTGVVPVTMTGKALAVAETLLGWVLMWAVFHGAVSCLRRT
jgi:hypothetical protein